MAALKRLPALVLAITLISQHAAFASAPQGLPPEVLAEITAPAKLSAGQYAPVHSWEAEKPPCGHGAGRVVKDPDASDGAAWEARPGRDRGGACIVFGPYFETPAGDYAAFFRLRLLDPCQEPVGSLDACVDYGENLFVRKVLNPTKLVPGKYVLAPLLFRATAAGKLECRVHWSGAAGLRVDKVLLYKITGLGATVPGRAPAAVATGKPADLVPLREERPFPDLFPKSAAPAAELLVCDLRKERPDMQLLLFCLQGLVNREQPRVYCISTDQDRFWLNQMKTRGWIQKTRPTSPAELLKRFRNAYNGGVITDPLFPATRNAATMLASVNGVLPASPSLAKKLGLPVVEDLRGRWHTNAEVYQWAFDHLWPRLNHHVIACLWPEHLALRDYLVENRVFIFWLSGPLDGAEEYASPQAEIAAAEQFLARMPVNIPVMGYPWAGKDVGIGEGPGVGLFAEFGKYLVGAIDCANLSVHSGIRVEALKQRPAPPIPEFDPTKVYYSFIISDGDNLPVLMYHNFPTKAYWNNAVRGRLPLGWTLSPSARILIPDIVDWYYRTAAPTDAFLGAVSGIGYTYPDRYGKRFRPPFRDEVLDGFLEQTAHGMRTSDLRDLWIMNADSEDTFRRYADRIPQLDALFPDYGKRVATYADATFPSARNVPVFRAASNCGQLRRAKTTEEKARLLADEVRAMTPQQRPAFLHVFVLNWFANLPALQATARLLGPDYVCVRPDHLAALFRKELQRRKVWLRAPATQACIEGQPVEFTVTLQDVLDQPLTCELRTIGLENPRLLPLVERLDPGREVAVRVSGLPSHASVGIEIRGDFGALRANVRLHRVARDELLDPLPSGTRPIPVTWEEAENRSHRLGEKRRVSGAFGSTAWTAIPEKHGADLGPDSDLHYIVFGPYLPLPAGRYVALFRLRQLGPAPAGATVAVLDACMAGGKEITGKRTVRAEELPVGQWRWALVEFRHPGGGYETRIFWPGDGPVAVDAIALWRIPTP